MPPNTAFFLFLIFHVIFKDNFRLEYKKKWANGRVFPFCTSICFSYKIVLVIIFVQNSHSSWLVFLVYLIWMQTLTSRRVVEPKSLFFTLYLYSCSVIYHFLGTENNRNMFHKYSILHFSFSLNLSLTLSSD